MSKYTWLTLLLFALLMIGCGPATAGSKRIEGGSINDIAFKRDAPGRSIFFKIPSQGGKEFFGLDFRGNLNTGSLRAEAYDPNGKLIWAQDAKPGPFSLNAVVFMPESGTYQLGMSWDGPVSAQYGLAFMPNQIAVPEISPLALFGGVGMVIVALGYLFYSLRRRLSLSYLFLGMLAWIVTVALKFAWAIPTNAAVYDALASWLPQDAAGRIFDLYIGALTGIFEVGVCWLFLRFTRFGRASWTQALAFGIGFGVVEALLLGLASVGGVAVALTNPQSLQVPTLQNIAQSNDLRAGLAPVVERFFFVLIHAFAAVLIFTGIRRKQARWVWLAFCFKTSIDAIASYAQSSGMLIPSNGSALINLWIIEAFVALWGLVAWRGILQTEKAFSRDDPELATRGPVVAVVPSD